MFNRAAILLTGTAVLSGLGAGCDRSPEVGPPPAVELRRADPDVAALVRSRLAEVERSPRDAGARGRLGQALDANSMLRAAATAYEQATALDPDEARWPYHLARIHAQLGDVTGALDAMDESVRRTSRYGPAHWHRGQWWLDLGRPDEAESAFRAALAVSPASLAARVGIARVHLQRGDATRAVAALEELVRDEPDEAYFRQLYASALRRSGDESRARREVALAANPEEPRWADTWRDEVEQSCVGYAADLRRAIGLAAARRWDEALPLFQRLRTRHQRDITLLTNLGAAYSDAGRVDDAIATLKAALELQPDHFGAHLNLSTAYHRKGDLASALHHAEKAVAANATLADARIRRGLVLVGVGRKSDALADFEAAQRSDPASPVGYMCAGSVYTDLKRWGAAVADFEAAIDRDPGYAPAWFGLAVAEGEAGDVAAGRAALQQAEQLMPNAPQRARIEARLRELANRE
jgi:tetratricopeptide (TPR) repeat protein